MPLRHKSGNFGHDSECRGQRYGFAVSGRCFGKFSAGATPPAIGAWPSPHLPFKCSTKSICAFESNRGAHTLNGNARNSQSSLRFSDTSTSDKLRWCCAEGMLEQTSKISRGHTCPLSERLD